MSVQGPEHLRVKGQYTRGLCIDGKRTSLRTSRIKAYYKCCRSLVGLTCHGIVPRRNLVVRDFGTNVV